MALTLRDILAKGPAAVRHRLAALPQRVRVAAARAGNARHCIACGSRFGSFLPHRGGSKALSQFLKDADYITGELDDHQCPVCWADDRERHLFLYFDALRTWDLVPGSRVLHIAPEPSLRRALIALGPVRYLAADLFPSDEDMAAMDVTAMPEPDESFDLVICNHVLEHVADVDAALGEVFRVLAPGGAAVLQTPYASALECTLEDPAIETDLARLFYYGQEDHCRLFGTDLFQRMQAAGFGVRWIAHDEALAGTDAVREGVSVREPLMLVTKTSA